MNHPSASVIRLSVAALGLIACDGDATRPTDPSAGGSSSADASSGAATGGAVSSGTEATGGATITGGAATGGAVSSGTKATGGATITGGARASGGTKATGRAGASGSTKATGGASSAGGGQSTGTGGAKATAGAPSTGGAKTMGGAPSTGGNGTTAGGSGGASPGCGSTNTTSECSKSGTTCSLTINSKSRTYYLQLPSGYSASKQYPLVFQFHPMGGNAEQALTMYKISTGMPDAIYVTPQGLTENGNTGWANTGGQDIAFTKGMLADVRRKYCVDDARIFATGFSYGGMMSFAIGCEMGEVFRAIAPMSGALYSDFNCKGTGHAIAMWGAHGANDTFVPTADGRTARDKILQQNHCGTQTVPIDPSPCVSYKGCDPGYPVTWCEWNGEHSIPDFGSGSIAVFFKQL